MATTERRLDTNPDTPTDDVGEPLETMAAWCDHHDLIHALLPFECRRTDTFAEFEALAEALRELPETAATFRLGDLKTPDGHRAVKYRPTGAGVVSTQLHLLGAWEYEETACGQRWINPHYIHDHPWQSSQCDAATRRRIITDAARLGAIRAQDLVPRFGISQGTFYDCVRRLDLDWGALRNEGRRRLARTLVTVSAWSDRCIQDLVEPFRIADDTLARWTRSRVDDAWTPPADPSPSHRFQKRGDADA